MGVKIIDYNSYKKKKRGINMGIGVVLKERMDYFNISAEMLSEEILVDTQEVNRILNNEVVYGEIDEITLEFISQVLYCKPEYFIDAEVRKGDLVNTCFNRGVSNAKSNKIKGILQSFTDDLAFLCELHDE